MWMAIGLGGLLVMAAAAMAQGEDTLHRETVEYRVQGQRFQGYLVYDGNSQGRRPGVLVLHEWWGLTPHIKEMTDQLAKLGYTALAADLYGEGRATTVTQEAMAWAQELRGDPDLAMKRVRQADEILKSQKTVDPERVAAMGFCMGGTMALEGARRGNDWKGAVIFHGGLKPLQPEKKDEIRAHVLVLHGGADPTAPEADVAALEKELTEAKVDWQVIIYGGAMHAFTNPEANSPPTSKFDPVAARRSWQAMTTFLQEIFEK